MPWHEILYIVLRICDQSYIQLQFPIPGSSRRRFNRGVRRISHQCKSHRRDALCGSPDQMRWCDLSKRRCPSFQKPCNTQGQVRSNQPKQHLVYTKQWPRPIFRHHVHTSPCRSHQGDQSNGRLRHDLCPPSAIEASLADPVNSGLQTSTTKFWKLGNEVFSRRLTQLFNTYWIDSIAPAPASDNFSLASSNFRTTRQYNEDQRARHDHDYSACHQLRLCVVGNHARLLSDTICDRPGYGLSQSSATWA